MRTLLLWTDLDVVQPDFSWDEIYRLSSPSFPSQKSYLKHLSSCVPQSRTAVKLESSITCSVPIVFSSRKESKHFQSSELGTQRAGQYTRYTGYTRQPVHSVQPIYTWYCRYTLYSRCSWYTWYNRYAQAIFTYTANSFVSDNP